MRPSPFAARCLSMVALTSISVFSAACGNTNNGAGTRCTEYLSCPSTAVPEELPAALQLSADSMETDMPFDRTALDLWDFGTKVAFYSGPMRDPELTGIDPRTGRWRCLRDDTNPSPPNDVMRMGEPNDLPDEAINLGGLRIDPDAASYRGYAHEICPDRTSPLQPDLDVFQFKVPTPSNVKVEVAFSVELGDLDVAIFRAPRVAGDKPVRITSDLRAQDNACASASSLPPGKYFVVVRGSQLPVVPETYAMGRYRLWVAAYSDAVFKDCP